MANRFQNPFPEFFNASTGAPRENARLFFYITGTATKLDTYSDAALSVANTNPIVLDENGRPEVAIFLQNRDYKVVLAPPGSDDPPSSQIWAADPVRASDFASFVIFKIGSGNPNGSVAGTAGSAGVLPTFYWDYTNSILYACTTTGTTLTAVWTALNSSSAGSFFKPAGRLTLTSATPVLASSVSAGTAVYYTPHIGNAVPVYNGANFIMRTFSELTLTLHSSHAISTIYDIFLFDDNGTLTIGTGPAWATSTAGSGARGTGAGTTQLSRVTGLYTNAVSMTARNGSTTYTVNANLGLYLGSMLIDGSAGQCSYTVGAGQSRKNGLWNAFNRVLIDLAVTDPTASWSYTTGTIRASNNAAGNKMTTLIGLPEESIHLVHRQAGNAQGAAAGTIAGFAGIGKNSSSASVAEGYAGVSVNSGSVSETLPFTSQLIDTPAIGAQEFYSIEKGDTTGNFLGTTKHMMMVGRFMG